VSSSHPLNFLVCISIGELTDTGPYGTLVHAAGAFFTIDKEHTEDVTPIVSKILLNMKEWRTKNSPLYSMLVQALWTSIPSVVSSSFSFKPLNV
jgi:hypothetical protein